MLPFLSKLLHSWRFIAKGCNCDKTKSVYNALFSSQLDWVEHRPFSKFLDISGEHQLRGKTIHQIEIQIKLQIKFKLHIGPVLRVLMAHYSLNRALVIAFAHKKLETSPVFAFLGKGNLLGWKRFTSFLYPRNCWKGWGFRQHR